jgi:hypothetical protein
MKSKKRYLADIAQLKSHIAQGEIFEAEGYDGAEYLNDLNRSILARIEEEFKIEYGEDGNG